jgi:hypothetical protein
MANNFLENYETVDERIHKFHSTYNDGRIVTDLIAYSDTQFIVKAMAYVGDVLRATGLAEERVGSSYINKTSALENCETSAIGRCLANLGLSAKGKRPSDIEMSKSQRQDDYDVSNVMHVTGGPATRAKATEKQIGFIKKLVTELAVAMSVDHKLAMDTAYEFMGCKNQDEEPLMVSASMMINDLKQESKGSSKFRQLLKVKVYGENYDAWETPTKG